MTPLLKFEITVCFSCFLCQLIHGHWRGLISRNGSVWPTLFLLVVLTAFKGTYNYILLSILRFRNTAKMAILKMKLCIFADELASLIPYHHK